MKCVTCDGVKVVTTKACTEFLSTKSDCCVNSKVYTNTGVLTVTKNSYCRSVTVRMNRKGSSLVRELLEGKLAARASLSFQRHTAA